MPCVVYCCIQLYMVHNPTWYDVWFDGRFSWGIIWNIDHINGEPCLVKWHLGASGLVLTGDIFLAIIKIVFLWHIHACLMLNQMSVRGIGFWEHYRQCLFGNYLWMPWAMCGLHPVWHKERIAQRRWRLHSTRPTTASCQSTWSARKRYARTFIIYIYIDR